MTRMGKAQRWTGGGRRGPFATCSKSWTCWKEETSIILLVVVVVVLMPQHFDATNCNVGFPGRGKNDHRRNRLQKEEEKRTTMMKEDEEYYE
jgi:hypothetical protein